MNLSFFGGKSKIRFNQWQFLLVDGCLQVEWMNAEQQKMWPETLHLGIIRMTR